MYRCHPKNQKFVDHFEKLRQSANACNNLNLSKGYASVIMSIRKYPLPISTLSQAEALTGVGSNFISEFQPLIDNSPQDDASDPHFRDEVRGRLEQLAYEIGGFPAIEEANPDDDSEGESEKRQKLDNYSPPIGSAPWACLLVLHLHSSGADVAMLMSDLKLRVRDFADKYPKTAKFNEKTVHNLAKRDLVRVTGGGLFEPPMNVRLTDRGHSVGTTLWQRSLRSENLTTLLQLEVPQGKDNSSYELILVLDNREFAVASVLQVLNPGIKIEQRTLPVGDFVWVWRSHKSDEYIVGYIVERKAIEDLSTSIKDGRYEEQRRRIVKSPGIETVIYIVEGDYQEAAQRVPGILPEASIATTLRHIDLTDNFFLIRTDNAGKTAEALLELHARIESSTPELSDEPVTYRDFASDTHKSNSMTVAQLTSRMLRSVPGVGSEAVLGLNDYLLKTGKNGLTLANLVEALKDPNINATIKSVTGGKRVPFSGPTLELLRIQYGAR